MARLATPLAAGLQRVQQVVLHVRLTPFDTATAGGRASERYRLAALAVLSNVGSRIVSMVLMVLSVSLTTQYLGDERFGVWATFVSMTAMLSFLDLGVGNALINRVAHAGVDADPAMPQQVVTGGVALLLLVGAGCAAVLSAAAAVVPWDRLFKLSSPADALEAARAAHVFALLFGLNVVSSGLLKLAIGQQRAHQAHLLSAVGAMAACLCLWAAAEHRAELPWLLAATFGVQSLAGLALLPYWRWRRLLRLRGALHSLRAETPHLMRSGALFLFLQVGTMIGWGSDSVLLAGVSGAGAVAAYAVTQRLFLFAAQPMAILSAPLWAAYADAMARGDKAFLRQTMRRSLRINAAVGCALVVILAAIGPVVLPAWTHGAVVVPGALIAAFAVWTVLEGIGAAFAAFLNGCGIVRQQVVVVAAFCVVALPAKYLAATHAGAAGLVAATAACYLAIVVLLYGVVFRASVLEPLRESSTR